MKIRSRIFLVFVLIIGIGMFAFTRWSSVELKSRYNESIEEPLVDMAYILAENLGSQLISGELDSKQLKTAFDRIYSRQISAQIFELEKTVIDMHIYVTDDKGIVLFDSLDESNIGHDFSNWNDVARTLKGEYGARSSPMSESGKTRDDADAVAFVAAPILSGDQIIGVVSVGKPKFNSRRFLSRARENLVFAALLVALSTLIIGFVVYRWVSRPLDRLVDFANRVSLGERVDAPDLGNNEIGEVGRAVQSMRAALEGKEYSERYIQALTHEFKSPLSAIRGAAELLTEDLPAEQRDRFYKNIQTETKRLEDIVERLLQLASLEKRVALEDVETIRLKDLVSGIVSDFQVEILKKNLTLKFDQVEAVEIRGERFLLRQAIANLLQNAIDFSPIKGEIEIICRQKKTFAELLVIDAGPGVPEYAGERIYERFYSLPRPDSGQKSTGLGLNFVKEVAELHHGSVVVERAGNCTRAVLRLSVSILS